MAITQLTCPECGGEVKSPTGFTPGETVNCPKCETAFVAREPSPGSENFRPPTPSQPADAEWSYKNSWIRYTVLAGLIVVMCVLGYMLYQKRMKDGEDDVAGNPRTEDGKSVTPIIPGGFKGPPLPVKAPNMGAGPAPKTPAVPGTEEVRKRLVGKWSVAADKGETRTVEYKDDGTFTFTTVAGEKPGRTIDGKWTATGTSQVPGTAAESADVAVQMEWTTGDKTLKETAVLRADGQLQHPYLDKKAEGNVGSGTFTKK